MTNIKSALVEVDIWGVCVSRDSFSLGGGDIGYRIKNYIQAASFPLQFTDHVCPDVFPEDFDGYDMFNAQLKWVCADINKNVPEILSKSGSEWLVIDSRCLAYGITKVGFGANSYEYISNYCLEKKIKMLEARYKIKTSTGSIFDEDVQAGLKQFVNWCKNRYGSKIILIETLEAYEDMDESGSIVVNDYSTEGYNAECWFTDYIYRNLECYLVKFPHKVFADVLHPWGKDHVHYLSEYYEYCYRAINIIVKDYKKKTLGRDLDKLYLDINYKIAKIRLGKEKSKQNTLQRALLNAKANHFDKSAYLLDSLINQGSEEAYLQYARIYKDGIGVEKDTAKALEFYRKAANINIRWTNELCDALCTYGSNTDKNEAYHRISKMAKLGYGESAGRLGRMYRDGQGVEKNRMLAIHWMRMAVDKNIGWAKNELFDMLWDENNPDLYKEMVSVADAFSKAGDGNAILRMGRAYRDGKGVQQNYFIAADYMRRAAFSKNIGWAKNELFDILWAIGTPESYKEMITVATDYANTGDGFAMGRLAHAYRDGKGVEKNLINAIYWMRKANEKNIFWARSELIELLWQENSEKSLQEIVELSKITNRNDTYNSLVIFAQTFLSKKHSGFNPQLSLNYAELAFRMDKRAINLLINSLWELNTSDSFNAIINYSKPLLESLDCNSLLKIGRIFRDGIGTPQSYESAAKYLRMSAEKGMEWANIELFDVLWAIGSLDSHQEMIQIGEKLANKGNGFAQIRLARAYHYGKGVSKNYEKSEQLLNQAMLSNTPGAEIELKNLQKDIDRINSP